MSEILSIEQIKKGLKDRRLYVVAKRTGLSYPTIKKLADGGSFNCNIKTLIAVSNYLNSADK